MSQFQVMRRKERPKVLSHESKPNRLVVVAAAILGLSLLCMSSAHAQQDANRKQGAKANDAQRQRGAAAQKDAAQKDATQQKARERQSKERDAKQNSSTQRGAGNQLSAAEERKILAFVKEHHPELTELLIYLKENQKRQYVAALRELKRTQQRLAGLEQRDQPRYDLELRFWKSDSRARLVAAKIMMKDRPELRKELQGLLAEQLELKNQMLEMERERITERLDRIQQQIDRLSETPDAEIQRLTRMLLREKATAEARDRDTASNRAKNDKQGQAKSKENTTDKAGSAKERKRDKSDN